MEKLKIRNISLKKGPLASAVPKWKSPNTIILLPKPTQQHLMFKSKINHIKQVSTFQILEGKAIIQLKIKLAAQPSSYENCY